MSANDNEEGNDFFGELVEKKAEKPYAMFENPSGRILHIYLDDEIKEPKLYNPLLDGTKSLPKF